MQPPNPPIIELCLPADMLAPFTSDDSGQIKVTEAKLSQFLLLSSQLDLAEAERLRRLAISLEHEEFEAGWDSLSQIYRAAEKADPYNPFVLASWAVSALDWCEEWKTADFEQRVRIARDGEFALAKAIALSPGDAHLFYALGMLNYNHPCRHTSDVKYCDKALEFFTQAVALDSTDQMSLLYKAHCLHDRKDWAAAYEAYTRVDGQKLLMALPPQLWRVLKLQEQLALCAARLGKFSEAKQRFESLFQKLEGFDEDGLSCDVTNLDESVEALTEVFHDPALQQRLIALVKNLGCEARYPELFA